MDLGSIIIGAIILAICIVPFIFMGRNRKKRERNTIQSLVNFANQQNCNISKHEICGDYIIGIDETKKFVFFIKQIKENVDKKHINLADIRNCMIDNTSRTVTNNNNNLNVIDKLELSFIPFDKAMNEIKLEFFNADNSMMLVGELQSIEKWVKFINNILKPMN